MAASAWGDIQAGTRRFRPEVSQNVEGRILTVVDALGESIDRHRAARTDRLPSVFHHAGNNLVNGYKA